MSDHVIVWEFDQDSTWTRLECRAPVGADCRLTGPDYCQCESWLIERADSPMATPFHRAGTAGGSEVIHWMRDSGHCQAAVFLDPLEECAAGRQQFVLAEVPVALSWEGDGYVWTRAETDQPHRVTAAQFDQARDRYREYVEAGEGTFLAHKAFVHALGIEVED